MIHDDDLQERDRGCESYTTSERIEQVRQEQQSLSKKRRMNVSQTDKMDHREVMHRFESNDTSCRPTARDFATRAAEHHPKKKHNPSDENKKRLDTTTSTTEDGKKIYSGIKEIRNKFLAGPIKAPTFVRTTCRFDYQPDICKDYKETGFCGYGDTCIYMHDRGDTISGWQFEREWEAKRHAEQKIKQKDLEKFATGISKQDVKGDDNDNKEYGTNMTGDLLPFACFLCREAFKEPVVTTCGHYFCHTCILSKVTGIEVSSSECPVCGNETHKVFNYPSKLDLKKRRLVGSRGTWEEFQEETKKIREAANTFDKD